MRTSRWRAVAVASTAAMAGVLLAACTGGGPTDLGPSAVGSASSAGSTSPTGPTTSSGAGTAGSPPSGAASRGSAARPPAHVVVVVFENKAQQQVLGSPDAPYLNALSATGARFSRSRAVTHPSQPNYLALFSGSTQGVTDDSCPQRLGDRPNLAQQLVQAGHSFAGYSEGMPSPGFTGCTVASGRYARKHNPWVDFSNVSASANLPLTAFPTDLSRLPTVSFVVPDLCHDMHDCDVATGDRWARDHLAPYVAWARGHNSLLVVTFDEDDGSPSNRILTFLVGPMVKAAVIPQPADHYSLLRTVEDLYGLEPLGAARSAAPLAGWRAG